jgi:hypothetical protein
MYVFGIFDVCKKKESRDEKSLRIRIHCIIDIEFVSVVCTRSAMHRNERERGLSIGSMPEWFVSTADFMQP